MAYREDEEKRIYELETAESLSAGTFVPVDKEGNEMAEKFDLGTALDEKVDAPSTAPEAGQVLTFDGTENTWANPPEGVYVINYSEVTDLDDIDTEKATTIPTFILIDSDQTLTIGNSTSSDTISINSGTIMRLEEVGGNDNGKPVFLTFVNDYGKSSTGGTYMTYGNYFVRLVVSKSMYGGVSKQFGVSADIWSSNLFRSQQIPVVKKYDIARGPSESSGNLNGDANSLIVSFEDAGSNKRRQLLPPAELASHDFSSDTTPEQIQFMGWGATSNRAGYKNLITAQHNYDSTNFPTQTPQVQFLKFKMSGGTPESDQVMDVVQASMKSSDGQSNTVIGGILVPSITSAGVLQNWSDSNGGHYGWKPVNEVPASTAQDEGKVLTVDSNGAAAWGQSGSSVMVVKYTSVPGSGAVFDKTFAEIKAALDNKIPVIMLGPNPNVTFDGQSTIGTEYLVQTYTIDKIVFRSTLLANPYGEPPNSAVSEIVLSSNDTIEYSKYVPLNFSLVSVYNTETITTSTYTIPKNNSWIPLIVDASVSSLTLNISNVDTLYPLPPNFAVEITPSAQLTLAVTVTIHSDGNPDTVTTLKHSVSAGNVLEAGKTYQVTVVGSCWTLAEFEA